MVSVAGEEAPGRRLLIVAGVAWLTLLLDQLTKHWALNALDDGDIDLVWTLRLHLVFNEGMAFSLGDGEGIGPFVGVAALVVVVVVIVMGVRLDHRLAHVAVGMIAGGAIGNLADRAFRAGEGVLGGRVVDFIDVQWWPVWNVADMAVVCGGVLLVIISWRLDG